MIVSVPLAGCPPATLISPWRMLMTGQRPSDLICIQKQHLPEGRAELSKHDCEVIVPESF